MEEIDKISALVWVQEVNNLVNYISDLNVFASNKNIVIKEIDYSLKTLYKSRKENDIINWIYYTEIIEEDLASTPKEITLFWIKVNLKYQL